MKNISFVKKILSIILSAFILVSFSGCNRASGDFTKNSNGNIVDANGVEYEHLANEGILYYLGKPIFKGGIEGEQKSANHMGYTSQTGMFSIENSKTNNILIRCYPNSEWYGIYRKSSLKEFDFTVDNCSRIELVMGCGDTEKDALHVSCGDGIGNASEIAKFLSEVRAQKSPKEAGLYDLIKKQDGTLENCYVYGVIYGFFKEEPYLVVCMEVTSYNDLAYSVSVDNKEYILPAGWLERLRKN